MDAWPRTFGHPTPNLILAQLKLATAQHGEAIKLLEALRDEGLRRKHNGLLVSIYAHLAYAHAGIGETEEAATNVQLAMEVGTSGKFAKSMTVNGKDIRLLLSSTTGKILSMEDSGKSAQNMLSQREKEVLALVAEGKRNAEIADILFASVNTVKNHLASVFRKLGATRRVDAVQIARQMEILDTSPERQAGGD